MVNYIFPGRIDKIEIGLTAGTNCDITNVITMNWERMHDVSPRLVASTKIPIGWNQPHSWVVGSFSLLSYCDCITQADVVAGGAVEPAYTPGGDSNVIAYFVVTYRDENNTVRTTTFTSGIIYRAVKELLNYDDSIWIFHFMAYQADDSVE